MTQEIFAPSVGQDITIGQHTNTFAISLGDSLLSSVKMSQVSGAAMTLSPYFDHGSIIVRR